MAGGSASSMLALGSMLANGSGDGNVTDALINEWYKFLNIWINLYSVYEPLTYAILALGLVGNTFALVTMSFCKRMKTPTFDYHLALVAVDMVFCVNFFAMKLVDYSTRNTAYQGNNNGYIFWAAAVYSGMIFNALNSMSSYMGMYMILLIAFDRVVAMILYQCYPTFNRHKISRILVAISFGLSVVLNSWSIWFEKIIIKDANGFYEWTFRNTTATYFNSALIMKDFYNVIIKIIYSILLSVFTAIVIAAFCRQQRIRKRVLSNASHVSGASSMRRNRRNKTEKNLFILMIAVAILAFVQVITRECRRLVVVTHPMSRLSASFLNSAAPLQKRLHSFRIALYGFHLLKPIANLSTSLEKSFIFYLYFALNRMFRDALLAIFCPRLVSAEYRCATNTDSMLKGTSRIPRAECSRMDSKASFHSKYDSRGSFRSDSQGLLPADCLTHAVGAKTGSNNHLALPMANGGSSWGISPCQNATDDLNSRPVVSTCVSLPITETNTKCISFGEGITITTCETSI